MLDWQTWCALAVVGVASAILARRARAWATGKSAGGCSACPSKSAPPLMKTLPLVQLGKLSAPPEREQAKSI
jgi:hypothetical protein